MTTPTTDRALSVRRASSIQTDPRLAVEQLFEAIHQDDSAVNVFFSSPGYDRRVLNDALQATFGVTGQRLVGCTTAGEISGEGFTHGLTGFSIAGDSVHVATRLIADIRRFGVDDAQQLVESAEAELAAQNGAPVPAEECFALLLVDGLSMGEEVLTYTLQGALGEVQLFGGSAGDGLQFVETFVYGEGAFHQGAAVVVLVHTTRPFQVFKTQHFAATDEKLVITAADVEHRIVKEINGAPAAAEYARLLGVAVEDLTPRVFARHPVMVRMGGNWYVRSIQKVNDDGTLTIYCAIDEGLVLTLGQGLSFVRSLEQTLEDVRRAIGGDPVLTIGCDCILRRLEVEEFDLADEVRVVFEKFRVSGFSTYGEQFGSVHVNQTFTGVAIG